VTIKKPGSPLCRQRGAAAPDLACGRGGEGIVSARYATARKQIEEAMERMLCGVIASSARRCGAAHAGMTSDLSLRRAGGPEAISPLDWSGDCFAPLAVTDALTLGKPLGGRGKGTGH